MKTLRALSHRLGYSLVLVSLSISVCAQTSDSAMNQLRSAAQDVAAGNQGKAEQELQAILQQNPDEYRAVNLLGVVRAQQHRNEEAEQLFQRVVTHDPQMVSGHVNLGLLYAQTSRLDEAAAQFREALRLDPTRTDANTALIGVLRTQARAVAARDPEKALSELLEAKKLAPTDPDVLYDFGMVSLRMSLYKDAADAFHGALAARKDDPQALYALGRAQMGQLLYQDARETFSHYITIRPEDASAHYAFGVTLAALQSAQEARQQFEKSISLQPVQTESYFQLGMLDLDEKHLDTAAEHFERVLTRDPKHAGALAGMGRVYLERKDYAKAADYLQRSIVALYQQRQAHYFLGLTYARMGKTEDSAKELQIASDIEHAEAEKQRMGLQIVNDPQASPKP